MRIFLTNESQIIARRLLLLVVMVLTMTACGVLNAADEVVIPPLQYYCEVFDEENNSDFVCTCIGFGCVCDENGFAAVYCACIGEGCNCQYDQADTEECPEYLAGFSELDENDNHQGCVCEDEDCSVMSNEAGKYCEGEDCLGSKCR